jgi:hypothetical protein
VSNNGNIYGSRVQHGRVNEDCVPGADSDDYADFVVAMSRGGHTGRGMHEGINDLVEDSPLEAPTSGFNRHSKLMSPDTRALVLKSRMTEIEAFAEDRGFDAGRVAGVAEAAMRMGKVPDLRQYGFAGDDAKAIKHFVAGEILNIAIEEIQRLEDIAIGGHMNEAVTPKAINKKMEELAKKPPYDRMGHAKLWATAKRMLKHPIQHNDVETDGKTVEEGTVSGGMGASMQIGSAFLERPSSITSAGGHEWDQKQEGTPGMHRLYPVKLGPSVPHGMDIAEYVDDQQESAGLEGGHGKPLAKKLRGKGKAITSPAEDPPGDFDSASGGTATGKVEKGRPMEDDPVSTSILREGGKTRAQRKKENKARFAKMSPEEKAATKGDAPFHPEAGKEDIDTPVDAGILREKKELHPSMKKHTNAPHFKAHVGDPDDSEEPFHKGKGLQKKEDAPLGASILRGGESSSTHPFDEGVAANVCKKAGGRMMDGHCDVDDNKEWKRLIYKVGKALGLRVEHGDYDVLYLRDATGMLMHNDDYYYLRGAKGGKWGPGSLSGPNWTKDGKFLDAKIIQFAKQMSKRGEHRSKRGRKKLRAPRVGKWDKPSAEKPGLEGRGPSKVVKALARSQRARRASRFNKEDEQISASLLSEKKKKKLTSPADVEPGEFDSASGGTAPGKKRKIKVEGALLLRGAKA